MPHGHAELGVTTPKSRFYEQGRFGRLFPTLPAFAADTPQMREVLHDIGAPRGIMDAGDDLTDPVRLITHPGKRNPDNPRSPAGMTFLGQFLDHDMTFDPTSSLARRQDPEAVRNFRIPALDLDSVYGGGPSASPHLYDQTVDGGRTTMLVDELSGAVSVPEAKRYDLPRNSQKVALIGDPRNDENLVVSQLQLAFLRFHNRVVEDVRKSVRGLTPGELFEEAQRVVRWHYQWVIVHEFLPLTVGERVVEDVLGTKSKHFTWHNDPYIPVEFSVGAYRFGHSQVRPSYRANFGPTVKDPSRQFLALLFDDRLAAADPDPQDLRGRCRAPRRFIDWQTFFDFGDANVRRNKRIDTRLSSVLFSLMGQPPGEPVSLATRNLRRSLALALPSGQRIAAAMQQEVLSAGDLKDLEKYDLDTRTPLWFYVLREAEVQEKGLQLGAVGGRIVAEVILGLLKADKQSYLNQDPDWKPTYADGGEFAMTTLLTAAGVVATLV